MIKKIGKNLKYVTGAQMSHLVNTGGVRKWITEIR